jgi:hypothetical protein
MRLTGGGATHVSRPSDRRQSGVCRSVTSLFLQRQLACDRSNPLNLGSGSLGKTILVFSLDESRQRHLARVCLCEDHDVCVCQTFGFVDGLLDPPRERPICLAHSLLCQGSLSGSRGIGIGA